MKSQELELVDHRFMPVQPVIGVDEVGRGCLAGAVYAAAVILAPDFDYSEITDSKKISAVRREDLSSEIQKYCQWSIAIATAKEIDEINILQASLLAMKRAVVGLIEKTKHTSGMIVVDGNQKIKDLPPKLKDFSQKTYIQGDFRLKPIGAASIIAKVARDRYMRELHVEFPQYGFDSNKAYASATHRAAIQKYGPCREHRKTFGGVKEYLHGFEKSVEL